MLSPAKVAGAERSTAGETNPLLCDSVTGARYLEHQSKNNGLRYRPNAHDGTPLGSALAASLRRVVDDVTVAHDAAAADVYIDRTAVDGHAAEAGVATL